VLQVQQLFDAAEGALDRLLAAEEKLATLMGQGADRWEEGRDEQEVKEFAGAYREWQVAEQSFWPLLEAVWIDTIRSVQPSATHTGGCFDPNGHAVCLLAYKLALTTHAGADAAGCRYPSLPCRTSGPSGGLLPRCSSLVRRSSAGGPRQTRASSAGKPPLATAPDADDRCGG
jgi:hypothetical protein